MVVIDGYYITQINGNSGLRVNYDVLWENSWSLTTGLTWIDFTPSMDKWSHTLQNVDEITYPFPNFKPIPKLQYLKFGNG